jgi:hypothetical protein
MEDQTESPLVAELREFDSSAQPQRTAHPNIYHAVVFDLNPRLKDILLDLARRGQIDCDSTGLPYLIAVRKAGKNHVAYVRRNGTLQTMVFNSRARNNPVVYSWDENDGFRAQTKQVQLGAATRRERQMRTESQNVYEIITDQLMEDL